MTDASRWSNARRRAIPEVYPVREDSRLLVRVARPRRGELVLEVGCGRGVAALAAARHGARRVVATDLNPMALRVLRARARYEALPVDVVLTDLANGLRRFDLILSNPPYLPTRSLQRDRNPWVNLALDGGPDGGRVTARLVAALARHLHPEGRAYVIVSSVQSPRRLVEIRRRWRREGGTCRTVAREQWGDEVLSVWKLRRGPPRSAQSTRGTSGRPQDLRVRRSGSSRDVGSGRTSARGGA